LKCQVSCAMFVFDEDDFELPELRPIIIGLAGKMKSGKSTLANFLVDVLGFKRLSFGEAVKRQVARGFGMEYNTLLALEKEEKEKLRPLYQAWGHGRRKLSGENYWVVEVLKQIPFHKHVVIDDIRYPNELRAIQEAGGRIGLLEITAKEQIQRGADRDWLMHESEIALDSYEYDPAFIVDSDGVDADTVKQFILWWLGEEGYWDA